MANQNQPPSVDELEISLFGPGYGEAILVHVGNGEWIAIDSCSKDGRCAPLSYLELLNVDVSSAVKAIVVSHWHDDHISGLAQFYERAAIAELVYPAAFQEEIFQSFLQAYGRGDGTPFGAQTSEAARTFKQLVDAKRTPVPALADRLFYRSGLCNAFALSPSAEAFHRFLQNVGKLMPSSSPPTRRLRLGPLKPNDTAIVVQIETESTIVLLGSDLEEERFSGWSTIVQNSKALKSQSKVFKVAHHGSKTGHLDELWKKHLDPANFAILTPFILGRHKLPRKSDVDRILKLSPNAYSTARVDVLPANRRKAEVVDALHHDGVKIRRLEPATGHLRLRCPIRGNAQWKVEQFDGAVPLKAVYG